MKTISIKNIIPNGISRASSTFLLKALEVDQKKEWILCNYLLILKEDIINMMITKKQYKNILNFFVQ